MAQWQLEHPVRRKRLRPAAIVAVSITSIALQAPSATACGSPSPAQRSVEAVVLVLRDCYLDPSVRQDREFIAPILQTPQGFVGIVIAGEPGHDRFRLRLRIPSDQRLVALWHTHGAGGADRELFSAADTRLANELGLVSYLTTPTGQTRVYLPGTPTPTLRDRFRRVLPHGVAAGSVVHPDRPATLAAADAGPAVAGL